MIVESPLLKFSNTTSKCHSCSAMITWYSLDLILFCPSFYRFILIRFVSASHIWFSSSMLLTMS
ncbi:hypothetical protein BC830DRAFT_1103905 [Chytriomyces sp. MP71]|nr:hypothetical protein BC830DRAFT_1103905 [Chytriomyces sp. MP71]